MPVLTHVNPLPSSEPSLVRTLGVRQLTAAIVNATVGAGIFVIPALVSQDLGAAAPVAFLLCAAIMACVTTSFAMAGSRVALTGGIYAYVEVAFGPFVAFLAGVLQWLTGLLAVAGVASALLDQLAVLSPVAAPKAVHVCVLALILTGLASLNVRGVRVGTRLVEGITVTKLAPLLVFTCVGAFFVDPSAIAWPGLPPADAIGRSVLLLIFAYSGVEVALAPSGHINTPRKQFILGMVFGLVAAVCQALGAVLSRKAFAMEGQNSVDGITAAYQRILGGVAVTAMFFLFVKLRGSNTSGAEKRKAWPWVLANGLSGPTLGVSCYQWALKTTPTGVVLPIVALTPIVIIPFARYLEGERPTVRSIAGSIIAVAGAAALALTRH